jgi:hypothetical protein
LQATFLLPTSGLGAATEGSDRMRKREVEKLLYHAVAEALGVMPETKDLTKNPPKQALDRPGKKPADTDHHHRAAA